MQLISVWKVVDLAGFDAAVAYKKHCVNKLSFRVASLDSSYTYTMFVVGQRKHGEAMIAEDRLDGAEVDEQNSSRGIRRTFDYRIEHPDLNGADARRRVVVRGAQAIEQETDVDFDHARTGIRLRGESLIYNITVGVYTLLLIPLSVLLLVMLLLMLTPLLLLSLSQLLMPLTLLSDLFENSSHN